MSDTTDSKKTPAVRPRGSSAASPRKRQSMRAPRRKKSGKKQSGHPIGIMFAVLGAVALIAMLWFVGIAGYRGEDTWVKIPAGATSDAVRDSLREHLGSATGTRVYLLWKLQGGDPDQSHGAYLISHGESALKASHRIARNRQTPVTLTFNNIRTMAQLADKISAVTECTPAGFLSACDSVLGSSGMKRAEYPAIFMPDSYEVYWTSTPATVIEKIRDHHDRFWTEERRRKAKALGLSPVEVATVASIVEEETLKRDERPMVARLYLNRLHKGMKLQADPTVKYAVGDFSLRRILSSHLSVNSPYNTYRHQGLPPGPIRMADGATIDAVLNAPEHDYLFMCARGDFSGYHNFARDFATHSANARLYRNELDRRNIR